jgi:hypothetical protein
VSRGIENNTASVHAGFLVSYNSVRGAVLRVVRRQLDAFPGYAVVTTGMYGFPPNLCIWLKNHVGHSLGGALASIAALSVKSNFPSVAIRLFTFGAL